MKICIDAVDCAGMGATGYDRHLDGLFAAIAADPSFHLILFVNDPVCVPAGLRTESVKLVRVPGGPSWFVSQFVLPRLAKEEKADVLVSPFCRVPRRGRFKKIMTVHNMKLPRTQPLRPMGRFVARQRMKASAGNADLVLTDSDSAGNELAALVPGIKQRLRTVYPGIGPEWFQAPDPVAVEAARKRYAGNVPYLLYVGDFSPHRNVDMLVRSFVALAAQQKAYGRRLLLVGAKEANMTPADNLFRSAVMADVVRICREVPESDRRALYAGAEWFVTASRYESFGFHAAEAMAMGCPVIYHPCEPLSEVVSDCALSIPDLRDPSVSETLHRAIIYSQAARSVLISRARSRIAGFTAAAAARTLEGLLGSLVGTAPAQTG